MLAVGEIGLDYYRDLSPREEQRDVFKRQLGLARQVNKPVIIHCRDAFDDVIAVLRGEGGPTLIAESVPMKQVTESITRVGPSDASVLITGDNGSGKGVVAQALHAVSDRAARPLVTLNTGGLSEGVFESELFGHVKGAVTDARTDRVGRFELADGGTLFLDEIANVTPNQQARLLRVLEIGELERVGSSRTRRVNVRVLAATNADLHAEVAAGATPATTARRSPASTRRRSRRCSNTPGPATCASSTTRSSAPS